MNIRKVSFGLIGATLMAGVLSSCDSKYENEAKAKAVKYLRGDELLKAERFARQQINSDEYNGNAIAYWDSLLIEAKTKEAYVKGTQIIKDSVDGKFFRKEKFKAPLDTVFNNSNVIEKTIEEYSKYVNAKDFIKARDNAPDSKHCRLTNEVVGSTHYWNLITIAGKQNEAYRKGMADERENQRKQKMPKFQSLESLNK